MSSVGLSPSLCGPGSRGQANLDVTLTPCPTFAWPLSGPCVSRHGRLDQGTEGRPLGAAARALGPGAAVRERGVLRPWRPPPAPTRSQALVRDDRPSGPGLAFESS